MEPIERRKVYELVAERLAALIGERGLRPGDALPTERELTQTFHVGRSSVREALRMLRFHLAVTAATRNRVAVQMMHAVRDLLQRALSQIYHIAGSPARSITQHRLILEAIRAQDPDAARLTMREHLQRVEADIQTILAGPRQAVPAGRRPRE